MSLFQAPTPTPVNLTGTSTSTAPQYLTDYLTQLAQTGQQQLGKTGDQLVAGLPQNLQDLYSGAQGTLNRYQTPMDQSLAALQSGAKGVSGADISQFYDPYQQDVVDEMGRQSNQNVQRNLMPALKSAFAGSGGFGSQRYANATGQALSDVESNLLGQQSKFRSEGYKSALDAALRDRGYDIQAGQGLYGLGQAESQAAQSSLKTLGDIGTQQLGYEQSKIEAPLARAQNVAQIMRGYTYPMTTTESKQQLPSAYPPSALQQIAGLGSLLGSGFNSSSGWGNRLTDWASKLFQGLPSQVNFGDGQINPNTGEYYGSLEFAEGGSVQNNKD
jgi:hypothetical protein